jgi:hypothetical protein
MEVTATAMEAMQRFPAKCGAWEVIVPAHRHVWRKRESVIQVVPDGSR